MNVEWEHDPQTNMIHAVLRDGDQSFIVLAFSVPVTPPSADEPA